MNSDSDADSSVKIAMLCSTPASSLSKVSSVSWSGGRLITSVSNARSCATTIGPPPPSATVSVPVIVVGWKVHRKK